MEMRNTRCFRHSERLALYQGTTFSRAVMDQTELGFTGCGKTRALYQGTTLVVNDREDVGLAAPQISFGSWAGIAAPAALRS